MNGGPNDTFPDRERKTINVQGVVRRSVLAAGLATGGAVTFAGLVQAAPASAGATTPQPRDYGVTATLAQRLCNLGLREGYGVGVELSQGILDVGATAQRLGVAAPSDMDDLLQAGRGGELQSLLVEIETRPAAAVWVAAPDLSFAPLVTRPEKIVCVGFNYRRHAEETGTTIPKAPPLFPKYNNALNRHDGEIKLPAGMDDRFDYETELVIVMGRECRGASEADALDHVAGYATGNDFSARTRQMETSQFTAGKTADGFAPVGPWLVTPGRVPNPNNLRLTTRVNGIVRQDWNTRDMIFDCCRIVAYVSSVMTLKPGDLIFTGTPQGVILGEKAPPEQRRWLRTGDEVISELEGLGALKVTLA